MLAMVTVKLRWGAASLSVFTLSSCPSGALFPAAAATSPTIMHQGLIDSRSIRSPGRGWSSSQKRCGMLPAGSLRVYAYHGQASLRPCRPRGYAEGQSASGRCRESEGVPQLSFPIPQSASGGRLRRSGGPRGLKGGYDNAGGKL